MLGLEPAKTAALQTLGELVEEQRLLQELHLALDWAVRRPPVLVEHWEARHYPVWGRGQVILVQICRIFFFIISQFLCH